MRITTFKKDNNYPSVKGRLKKNLIFWQETLSANSTILDIIDNGYKIPFFKAPKRASFAIINQLLKIRILLKNPSPNC